MTTPPSKHPLLNVRIVFSLLLVASGGCSINQFYVRPDLESVGAMSVGSDEVLWSVFLIGDAGDPTLEKQEPVLRGLERDASRNPGKSIILFLGDNIYPDGLPEETASHRPRAERNLQEQLDVVHRSQARGIFIPGNHDWDKWNPGGWASIRRQEAMVVAQGNPRLQFFPRGGSPGPHIVDIGEDLRLIILDTQWWLHKYDKPTYPDAQTVAETEKKFLDSLLVALQGGTRKILVAAHHPLESHGPHGGFFDWKSHIFPLTEIEPWFWVPLPVLGSALPIARLLGISRQDFSNFHNEKMRGEIESVMRALPPLAYVSGHEHSLQVLHKYPPTYYLVSGNGSESHDSPLTYGANTLFASTRVGYMRIDILENGDARLAVLRPLDGGERVEEVFSSWLRP